MSGYERPTERGSSPKKVSFWATIWSPDDSTHGKGRVSPSFATQPELVAWVRQWKSDGDQVAAWRRESFGTDYRDESLSTRDDPQPDPARLKELMLRMKADLDAKKRELDRQPKRVA
jgi:hypothetical protein